MMLPRKYKQISLAVLSLIMEAGSIVLDKYEEKLLGVLGAVLLAAFGFAISLFPAFKKNARLRNAKQDQVVQFVLSLIQLAAACWQLVQTVSNKEDKIDFLMFFPLAVALIAVIFAIKRMMEQINSQSGSLPLTNPRRYNSVPGSPDSGSLPLTNPSRYNSVPGSPDSGSLPLTNPSSYNSVPGSPDSGSLPLTNPSSYNSVPGSPDSGSLPLTNPSSYNSVPGSPDSGSDQMIFMGEANERFARLIPTLNNSVPGSTPIEPDGHIGVSTDEENVESPLTSSEPATLPGSTPIEPDGQNRISIDAENAELPLTRSEQASLPSRTPIEPDRAFVYQIISLMRSYEEEMRQKKREEETIRIWQQVTEFHSKPHKKIAHLHNMKPVTKPVANVARPSATLRRRGKKRI